MSAAALASVSLILATALAAAAATPPHEHHAASEKLGVVSFANSCSKSAQAPFTRGVAWLHSFEFGPAIASFRDALKVDPSCAIAEWGVALSHWSNPFAAGMKPPEWLAAGREAVERARRIGARTERERAWVEAVAELYADFERRDQRSRTLAYRDAMGRLATSYPEDPEATIFHALALAAFADPKDKRYTDQLEAGERLERLAAKLPEHPGIVHYIIHAYDVPPLAARAADAARRYAGIAPSAAHALHMPSHTFTRLGLWQDSIDTNLASADAARRAGSTAEELHALDYQVYAYLQTAQDAAARQVLESLPEIAARFDPAQVSGAAPGSAGVFALAAIPARYALERRAWSEAAKLEAKPSRFPHTDAMTHFARALGAARSGELAIAREALAQLRALEARLAQAGEAYWAEQVEIQRLGAEAWLAFAEGRREAGLETMRSAADREDRTEKNAVTPGPLAPARELLGEMLLEAGEPAAARAELERTLAKEPNRFNALLLSARAAARAGDRTAAREQYLQLQKICERGDRPGRAELEEARRFANAASI